MSRQKTITNIVLGGMFLLLLISNVFIIICPLFKDFLWNIVGNTGSLLKNLSLAYLGSYIFYFLQIFLPDLWKSHIEKNYMKKFFDSYSLDGFILLLKTCYSFPDTGNKISRQSFFACEKIFNGEICVAEVIKLQKRQNKKHYISLTDMILFSEAVSTCLKMIRNQVEHFRKCYGDKIRNEDLELVFARIIDNTSRLQSIYENSEKYSSSDVLLGGISNTLWILCRDLHYLASHYKIKSERRMEIITDRKLFEEAKKDYNLQIKNGLSDLVDFGKRGNNLVFKIRADSETFFSISSFLKNRGYKIENYSKHESIEVIKNGKKTGKIVVVGWLNFSIGDVVVLKHNYSERDLYWVENEIVNKKDDSSKKTQPPCLKNTIKQYKNISQGNDTEYNLK